MQACGRRLNGALRRVRNRCSGRLRRQCRVGERRSVSSPLPGYHYFVCATSTPFCRSCNDHHACTLVHKVCVPPTLSGRRAPLFCRKWHFASCSLRLSGCGATQVFVSHASGAAPERDVPLQHDLLHASGCQWKGDAGPGFAAFRHVPTRGDRQPAGAGPSRWTAPIRESTTDSVWRAAVTISECRRRDILLDFSGVCDAAFASSRMLLSAGRCRHNKLSYLNVKPHENAAVFKS